MNHRSVLLGAGLALAAAAGWAQQPPSEATVARSLAAGCANCHGTNGQARGDLKPLAGMSAAKLIATFNDFKSGAQPATVMHQIAKGYTDEQVRLIASYFAAQPAPK